MDDIVSLVKEFDDIENDIYDYLLGFMIKVEKIKKLKGKEKKKWVQAKIKEILGEECYERYSPFISVTIDFIISLSKNRKAFLKSFNHNSFLCC